MTSEIQHIIQEYADDIAQQLGIKLSWISVVDGQRLGCRGVHLLKLASDGQLVCTLVYQSELDDLQSDLFSDRLEMKVRMALSRLKILLEADAFAGSGI